MKLLTRIATAFITIASFSFIAYTSCKKDACKTINCKNDGVCADGVCTCNYLYTGNSCETEMRTKYYNTYKGNGINSEGDTYSGWSLRFYKFGSDADYMGLDVITDTNTIRASLIVQLQNKNDFKIIPQGNTSTGLTGYGTVNTSIATLSITDSSAPLIINFNEMIKQ